MSRKRSNGGSRYRRWLRRTHRWLGLAAALFVLVLSVTGIALNHSSDWGLDRRYVGAEWAARALGIRAPEPAISFGAGAHRATQLGSRIYLDDSEVLAEAGDLRGMVLLDPLVIIATAGSVTLVTAGAEIVEHIDLGGELPGEIKRIGRSDERVVLESVDSWFASDADVTGFTPLPQAPVNGVAWSVASDPSDEQVAGLKAQYRGRGLTVERLLIEIHSGRILGSVGPLVLDAVAVVFIVLSLSGIVVWLSGAGRNASTRRRGVQRSPGDR